MASRPVVRLAPGECPSGFVYYNCANGFKGCCSTQACDRGMTGCPRQHLPASASPVSSQSVRPLPSTTLSSRPTSNTAAIPPSSAAGADRASTVSTSAPTFVPEQKAQATNRSDGLSLGVILGVVFGALLIVICLVVVCCFLRVRRRRNGDDGETSSDGETKRWSELDRANSQSSHAALAEMTKMEEEGRRVANKVQSKAAKTRGDSGLIENPRGGVFEDLGGCYYSPDPIVANTDTSTASRLLTRHSSIASSIYSRRGSPAETEIVSPLSPYPATARDRTFVSASVAAASANTTAPGSPNVSELDSRRVTLTEAELPDTPSTPTFGLHARTKALQIRTLVGRHSGHWELQPKEPVELDSETRHFTSTWRGQKLTPAELPGYGPRVGWDESPLGTPAKEGAPRATLNATWQEKQRGVHVVSWGVYE